ncbi:MAG: tRNA pseudouridine synthase 10 [Methanolobus sp.]|jgi:tRNA pseudouridine synthase 10|uniref:tRNA pseudouridine synthase Pus10 n=2 Tax=Methanolobus TaxID=2220 RepID=W9DPE0_METTI|nr:tRNA pseudouridine(54/55) synthase Pus10 [Methanolobus tindarius]ETA67053.1 TIGR01213 family protein [Methanolobus tindarius DSM 2278]MDI3485023.1 tRNA pseudouridine synthase 10 [Methanolobus sp.]MDK2938840.1 tRNA pseudouridine synthase 10 [Methanolobus sp.]
MSILETAKKIIEEGPICDHCMGRQFAKLSTGLTNVERGKAIKLALAMEGDAIFKESGDDSILEELAKSSHYARKTLRIEGEDEKCWVCLGIFDNLDAWADRAVTSIGDREYSTFLVGTKVSGLIGENEEILWSECGITQAEQFKTEMNREVGKLISARTGKEVEFERPDLVITLDIADESTSVQVKSLYIQGRYRKLVRGIPQTRWPCRSCGGRGCEDCNNTGKQYPESVDELIGKELVGMTEAMDSKFHGAGREDIDALMLGTGRPFVVEAVSPKIRSIDVWELEKKINKFADGKVEVEGLKIVEKAVIETLKSSKADKVYNLKVTFKEPVSTDKLEDAITALIGVQIHQRTPQRVAHRRADLVRKRYVHNMKLVEKTEEFAIIEVHCDGGLYVKELTSGDDGRTEPSLTGLLGIQAKVDELNVIKVDI